MSPKQILLPRLRTSLALILSVVFFTSGCRQLSPTQPANTGTSSFTVVDEPPPKARIVIPLEPSTEPIIENRFVEAEPIEPRVTPTYPAIALTGKAELVRVGVRIFVDAEGRVTSVVPSLLTFSTPTRYADEFQEAVRQAVVQWRFHPAQHYRLRVFRTEEGGGPPQELHRENTETYFDLAFTFTAAGKVLPANQGK